MDLNHILSIKKLAESAQYPTVDLDPDDVIALCELALKTYAPDPLSDALNSGDGTYRP